MGNKNTAPAAENKSARTLTSGVVVGRAIEKLLSLDAEEQEALEQSPAQIKARYQAKRDEVLKELTDAQRAMVKAAVVAALAESEGPVSE